MIPPAAPEGARAAPGSFRDPQGRVFENGDRIFRAIDRPLAPFPHTWSDGGPLAAFVAAGTLWPAVPRAAHEVPAEVLELAPNATGFLEHPRLAPITFPFEWPFALLKRAALLHLDFHRALLKQDLTLSDGYAYNVQFNGTKPVFIDALAVVPYVDGQPWAGYSQFCESFLNPLLLASRGCEAWQDMYRGRIRGITTKETYRQLGFWGALRAGALVHVAMNSRVDANAGGPGAATGAQKFSKGGLDLLLASLARCIRGLELPSASGTHWGGYEHDNSYSDEQRARKHSAITEFVQRLQPSLVLDIGCNAGEYSAVALEAGAKFAVGLERDAPAVNRAVLRGDDFGQRFLPLQIDIQNTSPSLGWDLAERRALCDRLQPDALLCLALVHHLVLTEGLPLSHVLSGLVSLAPRGIIEFVPPDDPMARRILGRRERLTHPYDLDTFLSTLSRFAEVTNRILLGERGRVLVEYRRT